jgi:oligopeptide/dipeptide ABC transporter ATP-binding protein
VSGETGTSPVLEVHDLVKEYRGRLRAVDGVSLRLDAGEMLGIVGESGCGKSTLARILTGHERPTSGSVYLLGKQVDRLTGRALRGVRRDIQLVFQDPYASLDPRMTVGSQVREVLLVHRDLVPRSGREARLHELFDLVGLDRALLGRYPHQLSGGQRQRVGIARALAVRPRVLVCDEAVSALDVSVQAQILALLGSLRSELGICYVFISHDLSVVRHLADRVAVMYAGRVVETGTAADVYDAVCHPYTRALLAAAPVPDPETRSARLALPLLEGEPPNPLSLPAGCAFHPRCPLAIDACRDRIPELTDRRPGQGTAPAPATAHLAACVRTENLM